MHPAVFTTMKDAPVPYKSEAQRRYMHAKHPKIASRWDAEAKKKSRKKRKTPRKKG